jgi:hypothetical protein
MTEMPTSNTSWMKARKFFKGFEHWNIMILKLFAAYALRTARVSSFGFLEDQDHVEVRFGSKLE